MEIKYVEGFHNFSTQPGEKWVSKLVWTSGHPVVQVSTYFLKLLEPKGI